MPNIKSTVGEILSTVTFQRVLHELSFVAASMAFTLYQKAVSATFVAVLEVEGAKIS